MTVAVFSDKLFVFDLFSFYRLVSCRVVLVDEVVFCFKILLIIIDFLLLKSISIGSIFFTTKDDLV